MNSLIIPIYKNESGLTELLNTIEEISVKVKAETQRELEVVYVIDGSPDNCFNIIKSNLNKLPYKTKLISHSRNFGSFAAIRTGLQESTGKAFAVMAADLQEPPELVVTFFSALATDKTDIVIGKRSNRNDKLFTNMTSLLFWYFYKRFIIKDLPDGGVDIFGCNLIVRNELLMMNESNSSLIALIYWLGFRRLEIPYVRHSRKSGKSAWSLNSKIKYMMDSIFAFTDIPIKLLLLFGLLGTIFSVFFSLSIFILKFLDVIKLPGYTAIVLTIIFFGALNSLGLGIIGNYIWRVYENSKKRPLSIIQSRESNEKGE